MRKAKFLLLTFVVAMLTACGTTRTVPITGRKQSLMVSDEQVLSLSNEQYTEYMKSAKASTNATNTAMVKRVGQRLASAVEEFLRNNGLASELSGYSWEFNLVQDKNINAFCMPGGKIVVYEGIMNLVGSDDELAVVLGHEVAHAVAKHSNERLSQQKAAEYGATALSILTSGASASTQNIASQVFGLGANYGVMLPFSRKHETEADDMGLVLMTMAGYNPYNALTFWQKMAASSSNNKLEILSTHPSDASRIANLQKQIPIVKQKYAAYLPSYKPTTQQTNQSTKSTTTKKTSKKTTKKK